MHELKCKYDNVMFDINFKQEIFAANVKREYV